MDAALSIVIEGVAKLAADEVKLLCGAESAHQLLLKLNTIQPYLGDAEMRAMTDPRVGGWLASLKDVLYEADDALDEWNTKSQRDDTSRNAVSDFFTQCTRYQNLALRHNIGKKIQDINDKLTGIAETVNNFSFLKNPVSPTKGGESALFSYDAILKARMTDSTKEDVIGREEEIETLREMLVGESYSENSGIIIISVFGPPGCGKTSLAKHMFHELANHFMKRIWVHAPDILDEETIIRKMLDVVLRETGTLRDLQSLENILVDKLLKNNRLLLVIDDIWNVDREIWSRLYNIFMNFVAKGSRILVTTRHKIVAQDVCTEYTMHIGPLSSEQSLIVLRNNVVLEGKDKGEVSDLMEIGKKIVEKCGGVPLAITTIAGALRSKNTRHGWIKVFESEIWEWQPNSVYGILPALWLSYYHLSPHLKQCFRYCAIYPKGDMIYVEEVVQMWVANGYISKVRGKEMEDIGEDYFYELVARSLFQEPELDEYNNMTHFKMYPLIHDLARFVTKGEFLLINNDENIELDTQYPPLHCKILDMELLDIKIDARKLRTFISTSCERELRVGGCQIEKMQHLRVLELNSWSFEKMHDVVGKFVHLRFLKLCKGQFKASSSSIENLQNLLYLDLSWASIEALPESVRKLKKLRHLNLSYNPNFTALPSAIGRLTSLRKLDLKGTSLYEIPDCIGKLGLLWYLNLEATRISGLPNAIGRLTCLTKLDLRGTPLDEIPESIGKLGSLRYLNLAGTKIRELPESILLLYRLQVLDVSYCIKLKNLLDGTLDKMTGLRELGVNGISLQHGLPAGIGKLSHLQRLDKFWVFGNHEVVDGSSSSFSSSNICELRDLYQLHGSLQIYNLDMVTSGEEAASAQLCKKTSLARLALEWSIAVCQGVKKEMTSEHVLQALCPCATLHALSIVRYPGHAIPTWLGDSTMLSGLQELFLDSWSGCTNLPALGNLPELRRLQIVGMPMVRRVGAEWFGSNKGFPKLEYLQFIKMAEWEEWDIHEEMPFLAFPSLRKFQIYRCPKLRSLPPIFSTSLREIYVGECSNLRNWLGILPNSIVTLKSISADQWVDKMPSFPNLECLGIRGDGRVLEFSYRFGMLDSLKTLEIQNCPNLESLPEEMAFLERLQELEIYDCHKLKESCNKDGTQWYKIQHIPSITIDGEDVQLNA